MPSCMIIQRLLCDSGKVIAEHLGIVQGLLGLIESHFRIFAERNAYVCDLHCQHRLWYML